MERVFEEEGQDNLDLGETTTHSSDCCAIYKFVLYKYIKMKDVKFSDALI